MNSVRGTCVPLISAIKCLDGCLAHGKHRLAGRYQRWSVNAINIESS